jgi:hypothetical protein
MALDDVAPVLAREFVTLKLDFDRSKGAKEVAKRYAGKEEGLPWFAFIDANGDPIVTSTGPKGNVGTPWAPHEVEHFKTMLLQAKKRLTEAEIDALIASIQEFRKRTEAGK